MDRDSPYGLRKVQGKHLFRVVGQSLVHNNMTAMFSCSLSVAHLLKAAEGLQIETFGKFCLASFYVPAPITICSIEFKR